MMVGTSGSQLVQRVLMVALLLIFCKAEGFGQDRKFHFGANAGMAASQIDGDELRGFNKIGIQAGLVSGYSFNEQHWLHLGLEYTTLGSTKRNESAEMATELGMQTLNILAAYSVRFGDSWDGIKKFRVIMGPKFHRIIKSQSTDVDEEMLAKSFVAGHGGFSYIFSEGFMIDLSFTYSFANILTEELPSTNSLVPYYLTIGLTYYVFK